MKNFFVGLLVGVVTTLLLLWKFYEPEPIKVIGETHYGTHYLDGIGDILKSDKPPTTDKGCKKAWECAKSPIEFERKVEGDTVYVTARDKCKEARIGYRIKATSYKKHFIQGGVGLNYKGEVTVSLGYLRTVTTFFALGIEIDGVIDRNTKDFIDPSGQLKAQLIF